VILAASVTGIDSLLPDNKLAAAMATGLPITLLLLLMNKERCGEVGARDEKEEEEGARPVLVLSVQGLVLVASFNVPPPRRGLEGIDWVLCL